MTITITKLWMLQLVAQAVIFLAWWYLSEGVVASSVLSGVRRPWHGLVILGVIGIVLSWMVWR